LRPRPARGAGARWSALVALALAVAPATATAEHRAEQEPVRKTEAVLVGSSSFNQSFGQLLARQLEQRGYQVTRKGVSGAGLARPDFHDMNQVLESLPVDRETAAVFVYLGVNDAQAVWLYPHERSNARAAAVPFGAADWDAVYARRTREFLDRICQRGARKAIVLLPVDVQSPELQQRLRRIRELQSRVAAQTSCAVVVQTAGDEGRFEVAGQPTRLPDGYHMSERGAQIVWERIQARVWQLLEARVR
jgi:hypothetical protein